MAPKKATKQPNAPLRRSGRLASRESSKEPSIEPCIASQSPPPTITRSKRAPKTKNTEAVVLALTDGDTSFQEIEEEPQAKSTSSMRRDAFLKRIEESAKNSVAESENKENEPASPVPVAVAPSPPRAQEAGSAPSPPEQPEREIVQISTSPASEAASARTAAPATVAPSWRSLVAGISGWVPGFRKRKSETSEDDAAATPKRTKFTSQTENTPTVPATTSKLNMKSAREPNLSTISEQSPELSTLLSVAPATAPSKKRAAPSEPAFEFPATPQQSTPMPPPKRRSIASVRARTHGVNSPAPRPYAWDRQAATQKPKEPNADTRLLKLQQLEEYRAKIKALEEDPDIIDIESHSAYRRKRVKVDNLAAIPHNRPGDSSSTFRVPEIDSDDEMSVDEDVEEGGNMFEESEMQRSKPMEVTPVQPAHPAQPVQSVHTVPSARPAQPLQPSQPTQPAKPTFMFPQVATKPRTYSVSEAYKTQAGMEFAKGFAEYVSA